MVLMPVVLPAGDCATGMKIFPPERKLACCPLMAMMLGAASTRTRPSSFWPSTRIAYLPTFSASTRPAPPLRKSLISE
ncbi:hypothetical protein D3C83_146150 [compost metagenome]